MFGKPRWNPNNFKALSRCTDISKLPGNLVGKAWDSKLWTESYTAAENAAKAKNPNALWRDPMTAGFRMLVSRSTRDYLSSKKVNQVRFGTDEIETILAPESLTGGMIRRDYVDTLSREPRYRSTQVQVVNMDCLELALQAQKIFPGRRVACINMANINRPGGGWQNGKNAQEETLFMRTALSLELTKTEYPLGIFTSILCRNVAIIRGGIKEGFPFYKPSEVRYTNFVTVTGFDLNGKGPGKKQMPFTEEIALKTRAKIESMFALCANAKMDVLVLSALGCGAFRNPPDLVAHVFKAVLEQYAGYFEHIYFGIVGPSNSLNLVTFARILVNPNINGIQPVDELDAQESSTFSYVRRTPSIPAPTNVSLLFCQKGGVCTNESPDHFSKFTHPPPCPVGPGCTNRERMHRLLFFHYPQSAAAKAAAPPQSSYVGGSAQVSGGGVPTLQPRDAGSAEVPRPMGAIKMTRGYPTGTEPYCASSPGVGDDSDSQNPPRLQARGPTIIETQMMQQQQQQQMYTTTPQSSSQSMPSHPPLIRANGIPVPTTPQQPPLVRANGIPAPAPQPPQQPPLIRANGIPPPTVPQQPPLIRANGVPAPQPPQQPPLIRANGVPPPTVPQQPPLIRANGIPAPTTPQQPPVIRENGIPVPSQTKPASIAHTQQVSSSSSSSMQYAPSTQFNQPRISQTQPALPPHVPIMERPQTYLQEPSLSQSQNGQIIDSHILSAQPPHSLPPPPPLGVEDRLNMLRDDGLRYSATNVISTSMARYYTNGMWKGSINDQDAYLYDPIKNLLGDEAADWYSKLNLDYANEIENMRIEYDIPQCKGSALSLFAKDALLIPRINDMIINNCPDKISLSAIVRGFSGAVSALQGTTGDSAYCFAVGRRKIFEMCTVGSTIYLNGFVRASIGFATMNTKIDPSVKDDMVTLKVVSRNIHEITSFSLVPGELIIPPGIKYVVKEVNLEGKWVVLEEE